ncbi:MAG: LysM peptidoglycan-binding domain-containing protein [Chloroflexi bacterium]|nr:LysM peptidoglycan-binding domain-containing protein [Chloroflexota bacterium]
MIEKETPPPPEKNRCPVCDAVVADNAAICLMCGQSLAPSLPAPETEREETAAKAPLPDHPIPDLVESVMHERQAPLVLLMTAVFTIFIIILGGLVWQYRPDEVSIVIAPSVTPIPPTITFTPTWTPLPTDTRPPTGTPTITPTPAPTETPRPPRSHAVSGGETLFGLAFLYRVSIGSIAAANSLPADAQIQVNQNLLIPWPTATPPLEVIAIDVNGETVIADPRRCERYEVQEGDSIVGIATLFGVAFDLLAQVNRITDATVLQPGDTVCIPEVVYGSIADLPPTAGPSPTPTTTPPPAGPQLLYPVAEAEIDPPDGILTLQWTAVKNLTASEKYMVELTDESELDNLSQRGFTRDSSFKVPSNWRPVVPEDHRLCWRVSIVNVTGTRVDGLPIYTFGGRSSAPDCFTWLGAFPTPTPTATFMPSATPLP